jgi:hypothetical protein
MSEPENEAKGVAELVDSLHRFIEEKQVGADIAIISLVSTAGEIALSLIVAQPELKEAYLRVFSSSVRQVRKQIKDELKARKL